MGLEEFGAKASSSGEEGLLASVAEAPSLPPKELYGVEEDKVPEEECGYRVIKKYPGSNLVAVYCKLRHEFLVKNFVPLCRPSVCPIKQMWEQVKEGEKRR